MVICTLISIIIGAIFGFLLAFIPTLEPEQKILSNVIIKQIPSIKVYTNTETGINGLTNFLPPSLELTQYIPNWKPSMNFSDDGDQIGIVKKSEKGFTELLKLITKIDDSIFDADVVIMRQFLIMDGQIVTKTIQEFWVKKDDKFFRISALDSISKLSKENKQLYRNKLLSTTRIFGSILLILSLLLVVIYILLYKGVLK